MTFGFPIGASLLDGNNAGCTSCEGHAKEIEFSTGRHSSESRVLTNRKKRLMEAILPIVRRRNPLSGPLAEKRPPSGLVKQSEYGKLIRAVGALSLLVYPASADSQSSFGSR